MLSEELFSKFKLDPMEKYLGSEESFKEGLRTLAPSPEKLIDIYMVEDMPDDQAVATAVLLYQDYSMILVGVFPVSPDDDVMLMAVPGPAPSSTEEYNAFLNQMRKHCPNFNPPSGAVH